MSLTNSDIAQLCQLFNASLNLGHFSSPWKRDLVTMVPKRVKIRARLSPTGQDSKIFERIVLNRLLDIDTFNDALPNHQFGFRSRPSAVEQFHRVANHILDALEGHKYCCAVFLGE